MHSQLPTTVLHPINVWAGYPHVPLAGPVKFYYLLQTAFYMHQILVINAEARRKDHWQMLSHHLITVPLMVASYFYNYTRVGCLIMVLMDCSDIFLPVRGLLRSDVSSDAEVGVSVQLAKMLRYLGMTTLCDLTFVVFMFSWLVTRHILFIPVIAVTYRVYYIVPRVWDISLGHYMTKEIYVFFFGMLCALQVRNPPVLLLRAPS